ncbi:uncharacterized protein F4812DRAFT_420535, partial [Daldinia caldariorum]|uniref:uncharacterized protein n=1 Tax=Daldinia caldariorum TaxID=326644 RepID=UPI002008D7EF
MAMLVSILVQLESDRFPIPNRNSRYGAFKLIGLHPLCAVLFAIGYALREYGAYNYMYSVATKTPLIMFILSQIFIFVCPPLLELANYHVLGRIFSYVPWCAPLPPARVLTIFGGLMGLVELLNSLGVSLSSNPSSSSSTQSLGSNLTIVALVIQLFLIFIFVCLAGIFHRRCLRANVQVRGVKILLYTLYASMALILVRCIYRLVEHTGNTNVDLDNIEALRNLSPILRYEAFFYVFEATLMLINSILWNVWNPGRFLPKEPHIYLSRDGTEVRGEEESDDRPLLAKILGHSMLFGAFFRKKKQTREFEELSEYPGAERS